IPWDLAVVVLRVPGRYNEQCSVLNPAGHQGRPVAGLRTVEREGDPIPRLELNVFLAPIPVDRAHPGILSGVDLIQIHPPGFRHEVTGVEDLSDRGVDVEPLGVTAGDLQALTELLDPCREPLRINVLRRDFADR